VLVILYVSVLLWTLNYKESCLFSNGVSILLSLRDSSIFHTASAHHFNGERTTVYQCRPTEYRTCVNDTCIKQVKLMKVCVLFVYGRQFTCHPIMFFSCVCLLFCVFLSVPASYLFTNDWWNKIINYKSTKIWLKPDGKPSMCMPPPVSTETTRGIFAYSAKVTSLHCVSVTCLCLSGGS